MREFKGGATRNDDANKWDIEGFLSPAALARYFEYMHSHRKQADGKLRAADNWQSGSGIPVDQYMKSLLRHVFDLWRIHRGETVFSVEEQGHELNREELLCAIIFNAFGHLHELVKAPDHAPEGVTYAIKSASGYNWGEMIRKNPNSIGGIQ